VNILVIQAENLVKKLQLMRETAHARKLKLHRSATTANTVIDWKIAELRRIHEAAVRRLGRRQNKHGE
jgi:hypothetical protein